MRIYNSRFTPWIKAGDIKLKIGEIVQYQLKNGTIVDITIDSDSMSHSECNCLGFEAISSDDGERYFALGDQIVNWKGKVKTIEQLNKLMEEV